MKTAREQAEAIATKCSGWRETYACPHDKLVDAIIAALEEREREIERLKAETTTDNKLTIEQWRAVEDAIYENLYPLYQSHSCRREEAEKQRNQLRCDVDKLKAKLAEKEREIETLTKRVEVWRNDASEANVKAENLEQDLVCEREQLAEAVKLLTELLSDLPTHRDWLNPDLERAMRAFVRQHANKTVDTHAKPL